MTSTRKRIRNDVDQENARFEDIACAFPAGPLGPAVHRSKLRLRRRHLVVRITLAVQARGVNAAGSSSSGPDAHRRLQAQVRRHTIRQLASSIWFYLQPSTSAF